MKVKDRPKSKFVLGDTVFWEEGPSYSEQKIVSGVVVGLKYTQHCKTERNKYGILHNTNEWVSTIEVTAEKKNGMQETFGYQESLMTLAEVEAEYDTEQLLEMFEP